MGQTKEGESKTRLGPDGRDDGESAGHIDGQEEVVKVGKEALRHFGNAITIAQGYGMR